MSLRCIVAKDLQYNDHLYIDSISGIEDIGIVGVVDVHPDGAVAVKVAESVIAFMAEDRVHIHRP